MWNNPVLELLGKGSGFLRVPKDGSNPEVVYQSLVFAPTFLGARVPVKPADVEAAIDPKQHLLHRLSEFGEGQRIGWREIGLDGDVADWYVWTQ